MADSTLEHAFFYNSNDGDRVYDASSFEYWLKKFFTSGVFADECQVTADGSGMTCTMAEGYTNVDGKVKFWDEAQELTLATASSTYDRIDNVVIERNDTDRDVTVKIVQGEYAASPSAPDVERDDGVYQLVLAQIYVSAGATSISQADVTDTRTDTDLCGIVTGTVTEMDFSQFTAQYESFIANYKTQAASDYSDYSDSLASYLLQLQTEFESWFANIQDQLSEDAAGNLQVEIDELEARLSALETMALTDSYYVPLEVEDEDSDDLTLLTDDDGTVIAADWSFEIK